MGSLGLLGLDKSGELDQIAGWISIVDYPFVWTPLVSIGDAPLLSQGDV